jgi:hypothetical protein
MLPDDIVNLSAFLITGRTVQYLAWLVLHLRDDPSAVSRQQIDDVLQHLDLARNTLIARLNHYQLLASGLDAKSAAALAAAADHRRRPWTRLSRRCTILRRRSPRNPPLRLTTTTSTPCALSAERLADEGRKHHGHKDLKNSDSKHSDSERPPAPKKIHKTKPAAQPASTVADASA